MKGIRRQVDKLVKAHPGKHICIGLDISYYENTGDKAKWKVYIEDHSNRDFKTWEALVRYVNSFCEHEWDRNQCYRFIDKK